MPAWGKRNETDSVVFDGPVTVGTAPVMAAAISSSWNRHHARRDQRGDPQKLGPCGGTSANAGTPTGSSASRWRIEAAHQGAGNDLSPGFLSRGARGEVARRVAAGSGGGDARNAEGAVVDLRRDPEQSADAGDRRRPVLAPHSSDWPMDPNETCRTSTARSARCRSSSSWRITATTRTAATRITTAPTSRSPLIRQADRQGWPGQSSSAEFRTHSQQDRSHQ